MNADIRLPPQWTGTEKEQLKQAYTYLFQLAQTLQWMFERINPQGVITNTTLKEIKSSENRSKCEILGLSSLVAKSDYDLGRGNNGTCCYRVINGNHIFVAFNCSFTYSGESITVNASQIPSPYKPARNVYSLCPVANCGIARILVNPSGEVCVDWVHNVASVDVSESFTVDWIDGYIDYWV